jgi:biotin synthase
MVYNMGRMKALKLIDAPLTELLSLADEMRREHIGNCVRTCGVVNAKSGACSEDCKFCAQSAHHNADTEIYGLKSVEEIVRSAARAKDNGADRFGIVTSGNRLSRRELDDVALAVRSIKEDTGIEMCASLGALTPEELGTLREAGLSRYHHNIETSPGFYTSIVSTHSHEERVNTIKNAKAAGLEVCSGGILGMGESWEDRIDMALLLAGLEVDSVPLNFLVPVKGTPLENSGSISPFDAVRATAIFRLVLESADIKIVAGREGLLKDYQAMLYLAGANGMMVGGYLTTGGRSVSDDNRLIRDVTALWSGE